METALLNYAVLAAAKAVAEPFPYLTATGLMAPSDLEAVKRDFPRLCGPGLFPLSALECRGAFAALIDEIQSLRLGAIIGAKFGLDLADKPLMITVRGWCQKRDGRLHTDSKDKLVSCLLYLNDEAWSDEGGRFRLYGRGDDPGGVIAETLPIGGAFVAFRRSDNSWHGHAPFEGRRRYIMFNWLLSEVALAKNLLRHRLSAAVKQLSAADVG